MIGWARMIIKRQAAFSLVLLFAIVIAVVFLLIGHQLWWESDIFKVIWRLIWLLGVPVLLFLAFKAVQDTNRRNSDKNPNP